MKGKAKKVLGILIVVFLMMPLTAGMTGCQKAEKTESSSGQKEEKPSSEKETKASEEPAPEEETSEEGLPFPTHGKLSVDGIHLVDENKEPYQLRGVSIFFLQYANIDAFRTMRDEWGINMVRLPMYTAGWDGYCTVDAERREALKQQIYDGIDAATELGLYVIMDWHVLHEGDPNVYLEESKAFFKETTEKYEGYDNILYEICNEPNGNVNWGTVKSYAEQVIPVIREKAKDAVIIVGTPTWSQDVDQAAADPLTCSDDLMYALHFYAETHRDDLRQKMTGALEKGLPVFVSEFGISDASGNGRINTEEGDKWMELINQYGLSFSIWSLSNKDESSAILLPSVTALSGWSYEELTDSGKWFLKVMEADTQALGDTGADAASEKETSRNASSGEGNLKADVQMTNTWESGGKNYFQYVVDLTNTSQSSTDTWKCEITFDKEIKLSQSWCGAYSVSGDRLTITPESYNAVIEAGASLTDVGFILETDTDMKIKTVICE